MKRFVTRYGTRALVAVLALVLAGPIGYAGAARSVARAAVLTLWSKNWGPNSWTP